MKGKKSDILYEILRGLAIGGAIFLTLSSPYGARKAIELVHHELARRKHKREYLLKKFYYLRDRHLVDFIEEDGKTKIVLNENGRSRILEYEYGRMAIKTSKTWDHKWRIVIFDIPEAKKKGRDALTRKLKLLGLKQFNKSAWIFPHECKDEIDFVAEFFGIGIYVHYLVVESMTNAEKLKVLFEL